VQDINAQAYSAKVKMTKKKSFIQLTSGHHDDSAKTEEEVKITETI
jgi:hypothetical protein